MPEGSAKSQILSRIRQALNKQVPKPFPDQIDHPGPFKQSTESLDVRFAEAFVKLNGQFIYCSQADDFYEELVKLTEAKGWKHIFVWNNDIQEFLLKKQFRKFRIGKNLQKADAGLTFCEALVARTGSILISSRLASGRSLSLFPPAHIVIAFRDQIVPDISEAMKMIEKKYPEKKPSMISLVSGPSRTADIEKTLVLGAHGPKEVFVFLIENSNID